MEIQPLTIETLLRFIRERAATIQVPEIVDARIAITPGDFWLSDLKPERALEIIYY